LAAQQEHVSPAGAAQTTQKITENLRHSRKSSCEMQIECRRYSLSDPSPSNIFLYRKMIQGILEGSAPYFITQRFHEQHLTNTRWQYVALRPN
jgi:hypothetical protein